MRIIFLLVLIAGIGISGLAGMMAVSAFDEKNATISKLRRDLRQTAAKNIDTGQVVIMQSGARYGTTLKRDMVKVVRFPVDAIPPNAFTSLDALFGKAEENKPPRLILRTMDPFDTLTVDKLTDFGEDAGLVSRLGQGIRAFTLRVNVSSAVAGFLRPGDKVDVLWLSLIHI